MKVLAKWAVGSLAMACLMAVAAQEQGAQPAPTYRITGVVVNSVNGRVLAQTRVLVAAEDGSSGDREVTTGADGRFAFEGMPAGVWRLSAEHKGFGRQVFEDRMISASSVITGPDGASENLIFRLNPPSAISGKVTDERGEPVPGAHLQLLMQIPGARKQFLVRKVTATDDQGEYRMWGLAAATCYLLVIVPLPAGGGGAEPNGFAPQYFPNTSDPRAATPIQLKPGEEFTADFVLRRARGVSVEVEGDSGIRGANQSELLALLSQGPAGAMVSSNTLAPGQGRTFYNVPPGRYKLVIGDVQGTFATTKWIEVGSEDVTVTLPFPDPPDVTAKVRVVDGDASLLKKAMLRLYRYGDPGYNMRPLDPDGTARFPAQAADRYVIDLRSEQLYIRSVSARNARVVDGQVELPETGAVDLEIVAGGDGAMVKGKVRANGKPARAVLVVLAPRKESGNPSDYSGYQSESDGSFSFPGVRPGEYVLFATTDWQLEFASPAAIRPYLAAGKLVKAEANKTVEVEIGPQRP
jgi:hypothetical protein